MIFDGRSLRPQGEVRFSPVNSGLLFGEALFETVPVYRGRAGFLSAHLRRLQRGCGFLGWRTPPRRVFERALRLFAGQPGDDSFLVRFNLHLPMSLPVAPRSPAKGAPRLWAFRRPLVHPIEYPHPRLARVGVGPWTVPEAGSLPQSFKWPFYLTTREALSRHPSWQEMVRVDREGFAVDGAFASVMWFDGRALRVPPRGALGLEGVTREQVLKIGRKLGLPVVERRWKPGEAFRGGELLFAGSGTGVMAATHMNGKRLPRPRLVFELWRAYRRLVLGPGHERSS